MDIHILPRKRWKKWKEHDVYILANKGIDAALLAMDLGLSERFVVSRQRKLGLRKLTSPNEYRKPRRVSCHVVPCATLPQRSSCYSEGQVSYARMILRMTAEEIENGMVIPPTG